MSSDALRNYFKEHIKDDNIWLYIFGDDDPEFNDVSSYYGYINNTINLTFMYIIACIRNMKNNVEDIDEKIKVFNPNAKRVIKNIDRVYKDLDINYELISYILLDVQFDLALGDSSCLNRYLFGGISSSFKILDYNPRILFWMKSSDPEPGLSPDKMEKLFKKLVNSLPFLSNNGLVGEKYNLSFEPNIDEDEDDDEQLTHSSLPVDYRFYIKGGRMKTIFFLEKVEKNSHFLKLFYSTPDYADKCVGLFYDKEYDADLNANLGFKEAISKSEIEDIWDELIIDSDSTSLKKKALNYNEISNVYAVNYKYIKNLAFAIADELGKADRNNIRISFLKKCGAIDENGIIDKSVEEDLDSFIIMKLIDLTPRKVLKNLFIQDKDIYHTIIRNLYRRYNRKIKFKYVDFTIKPANFSELDEYINSLVQAKRENLRNIELAEQQANYVISMILDNVNEKFKASSITEDIEKINSERHIDESQIVLANHLIRLICFYAGIIEYGKEKIDYEALYYDAIPTQQAIKRNQNRLIDAFLNGAKAEYDNTFKYNKCDDPKQFLLNTIDSLLAFFKGIDDRDKKAIYRVLGRDCVSEILKNRLLTPDLVERNDEEQNDKILKILEFLNSGSIEKNEAKGDFNSMIYPSVGQYVKNSQNNDQFSTACFSIRLDTNLDGRADHIKSINVLTEFDYAIDDYYYCLPNVGRSNYEWWIDPLIISVKDFDSIFIGD